MTEEHPVTETLDTGAEEIPEPVVTPDPEEKTEHESSESRPEFVDEILDALDGIAQRLTADAPAPIEPIVEGTIEPDTSPSKPPWTHRHFFGRKG